VPGSDPPRYTVDGAEIDVDVRIPDDLSGWYWSGSFLCHDLVWVAANHFGVPGVFEQARTIERVRAEREAKQPPRQLVMEL
jgi:hypothetical protein